MSLKQKNISVSQVSDYITNYYKKSTNSKAALNNLAQLNLVFGDYIDTFNIDFIVNLLSINENFKSMIESVFKEYEKQIKKGLSEELFDNQLLFLSIEAYCIMNDIDINEIDDVDNESEDTFADIINVCNDTFSGFIRECTKMPLLTFDEERKLLIEAASNNEEQSIQAKKELIRRNMRLVMKIAFYYQKNGYCQKNPCVSYQDLVQEGMFGLARAIDKFDISRHTKFSSYAFFSIKKAITDAFMNNLATKRIPLHTQDKMIGLMKCTDKLIQILGRYPTLEELSNATHLKVDVIKRLQLLSDDTCSLNEFVGGDEDGDEFEVFIPSTNSLAINPITAYEQENLKASILQLLDDCKLTSLQKQVILYRYGFIDGKQWELKEIAEELGKHRESIRQCEATALRKLREYKNIEKYADYMRSTQEALENLKSFRSQYKNGGQNASRSKLL